MRRCCWPQQHWLRAQKELREDRGVKGLSELAAVVVGASLGTGLRLAVDLAIPEPDDAFPVATLLVNTLGAFMLGMLVARLWRTAPSWLRAGLGAGLLGSFTTFSAIAVSLVSLTVAGSWLMAVVYLTATLGLGLGSAWLGLSLGNSRDPVTVDEVTE
jgi:CrcB protein